MQTLRSMSFEGDNDWRYGLVTIPIPTPTGNELLVRTNMRERRRSSTSTVTNSSSKISSFNPAVDVIVSGTVSAIGKGVKLFEIGDRVLVWNKKIITDSYVTVLESQAIFVPDEIPLSEAQARLFAFIQAYHSLVHKAKVQKLQTILVAGAAKHINDAYIDMAKLLGAKLVATLPSYDSLSSIEQYVRMYASSRQRKAETCWNAPLDVVIDLQPNSDLRRITPLVSNGGVILVDRPEVAPSNLPASANGAVVLTELSSTTFDQFNQACDFVVNAIRRGSLPSFHSRSSLGTRFYRCTGV